MTIQKALKELLIVSPFYGIFLLSLRKEIVNVPWNKIGRARRIIN